MLANRYLLNNEAKKAIALYRQALEANQNEDGLRCKLIAACLKDGQIDSAIDELDTMVRLKGDKVLDLLGKSCKGYVPEHDLPENDPVAQGLWLLLEGRLDLARRLLVDDRLGDESVTRLAGRLWPLEPMASASKTDDLVNG